MEAVMPDLRLPKIPDRTPIKLTIQLLPDLSEALRLYAAAYEQAYGKAEPVAELIPFMLSAFLESDRAFARAKR
jgi:hypothetical protein